MWGFGLFGSFLYIGFTPPTFDRVGPLPGVVSFSHVTPAVSTRFTAEVVPSPNIVRLKHVASYVAADCVLVPYRGFAIWRASCLNNRHERKCLLRVTAKACKLPPTKAPTRDLIVRFGDRTVPILSVVNGATSKLRVLSVTAPQLRTAMKVNVTVFHRSYSSRADKALFNFYNPSAPRLAAVTPSEGSITGGTEVTFQFSNFPRLICVSLVDIEGSLLQRVFVVRLGGVVCRVQETVVGTSRTFRATVITPPRRSGGVAGGTITAADFTFSFSFSYFDPSKPVVESINPSTFQTGNDAIVTVSLLRFPPVSSPSEIVVKLQSLKLSLVVGEILSSDSASTEIVLTFPALVTSSPSTTLTMTVSESCPLTNVTVCCKGTGSTLSVSRCDSGAT